MKNNYAFIIRGFHRRIYPVFSILFISFVTALVFSCAEDEPGRAALDVGELTASRSEVVIEFDKPTDDAVVFSWHAEKTSQIQYQVVFTAGGNTGSVDVASEISKTFTHSELNRILIDDLKLPIGEVANIDVEVHGRGVSTNNTGVSGKITIAVVPAQKVDVALLVSKRIVTVDNANLSNEALTILLAEKLNAFSEHKVIFSAGSNSASIDMPAGISREFTNQELNEILIDQLQLTSGQESDVDVKVSARRISNDESLFSNMITLSVTPNNEIPAAPAYSQMWIVGNATPNGWDIGNPNVMETDPTNIYQFKYNEKLNGGEFKIPVATGNWNGDYYMPLSNHPPLASTDVKFTPGGNPDNKWNVENGGAYKIVLNIGSNPSIRITPFSPHANIYIVGDATVAGWNANNAMAMTVDPTDPNVLTWTGELKSTGRGQFRFLVQNNDVFGNSFVAPVSNADLTATQLAFINKGGPVNSFSVKVGEEGTYKITINQLKETISIVRQ